MHVVPLDDLVEHDTTTDDCHCGPTTETVFRDDGSNGYVIRHAALDARERQERATGRGTGRPWWFGREGERPQYPRSPPRSTDVPPQSPTGSPAGNPRRG